MLYQIGIVLIIVVAAIILSKKLSQKDELIFEDEMDKDELKKIDDKFQVDYAPDYRQNIADSWPNTIDDTYAREDWGWNSKYDFKKTINHILSKLALI